MLVATSMILESEDVPEGLGFNLGLDFGMPRAAWRAHPSFAVVGAGAEAALMLGLQHRRSSIVVADASSASVERCASIAESLGLEAITFRNEEHLAEDVRGIDHL